MIIDEGFGCMDEKNITKMEGLMGYLQNTFENTLIISHVDRLKDMCHSYLHITKSHPNTSSSIYI
jgi:DNA repair exonuclease SbcCD ATPase subunit